MTDKFRNKYRISSARLQHWNYGAEGSYFITICTNNRQHYFGDIKNDKMYLSEIGKIVEKEWLNTFTIRADMNLEPGEFIVMPNHFHAIIIIGNNEYNQDYHKEGYGTCRDAMHGVSTASSKLSSLSSSSNSLRFIGNKFGPQSKNLASIVRGFKSSVTKHSRLINSDFKWQERYHDHIIRNADSFEKIQNYIIENPLNWKNDKFNT